MGEIWLISGSTLSLQKGERKENIEVVLDSKEICVFSIKPFTSQEFNWVANVFDRIVDRIG